MRKELSIFECVPNKEWKEGKVLLDFIRMILPSNRVKLKKVVKKKKLFQILKKNNSRYIHISCHGDEDKQGSFIALPKGGKIRSSDFRGVNLRGRTVVMSGCRLGKVAFADDLHKITGAKVFFAPQQDICFPDSAAFWVLFYYNLFQKRFSVKRSYKYAVRAIRKGKIVGWEWR